MSEGCHLVNRFLVKTVTVTTVLAMEYSRKSCVLENEHNLIYFQEVNLRLRFGNETCWRSSESHPESDRAGRGSGSLGA